MIKLVQKYICLYDTKNAIITIKLKGAMSLMSLCRSSTKQVIKLKSKFMDWEGNLVLCIIINNSTIYRQLWKTIMKIIVSICKIKIKKSYQIGNESIWTFTFKMGIFWFFEICVPEYKKSIVFWKRYIKKR